MKILIVITMCSIFFACNSNTADTKSNENSSIDSTTNAVTNVPFTLAKNYFVKNTFKQDSLTNPEITTQKDFDAVFGMASTMSADGKPTPIDFSMQHVLAVIQPVTDKATTLTVESLTQKENNIVLNFSKAEGEKQSFSTRPYLLLIVDNKYNDKVKVQKVE